MSPDEWTSGRLNDLAAQVRLVAALSTQVATHQVKIDGVESDIDRLTTVQREAFAELHRILQKFDEECDRKVQRLEKAIKDQGVSLDRKIDTQADKIEQQARDRQWSPMVKAALFAPLLGSLGTALAVVLK